jgi:predicted CopG family antitoxin
MVKTIRISNDDLHRELLKIQGEIQAKTGEFTSMDDVINTLVKNYKKKS